VALRIAQWPQSIILLLPCRVPECDLNNFSIKLSVCYVVLENGGYVRLGRCEQLPRRSRHGGNILLEIYCARRRLTGTSFHSRLATTRRNTVSQAPRSKRYAGLTIPDDDYLPLHIWPLVGLELIVVAHVV
jgi:hypothetical protein